MEREPDLQRVLEGSSPAVEQLTAELERQSKGGPGVEKQTAAMFCAIINEVELRPILAEVAEHRLNIRGIKSAPAVSAIRSAFITYFRANIPGFSDENRHAPADWEEPLSVLKEDLNEMNSMEIGSFLMDVTHNETNTPVAERYYTDELIAQLVKDRFPKGIRALDIGSSIMVGALHLTHKNIFPMSFQEVRTPGVGEEGELTDKANEILQREGAFKKIVCVDNALIYFKDRRQYDSRIRERAISCLRPSERANPDYLGRIHTLTETVHRGSPSFEEDSPVSYHQGNLLNPIELGFFKEQHPEKFDMIMVNYLTQELPAEDQIRLHDAALELLSEQGLLIYNHQAYIHPWNAPRPVSIHNLRPYESFATTPYSSSMHLVDNMFPVRGIQEMMRYRDNRCHVVRLGMGELVVNGAFEPIHDLVKYG